MLRTLLQHAPATLTLYAKLYYGVSVHRLELSKSYHLDQIPVREPQEHVELASSSLQTLPSGSAQRSLLLQLHRSPKGKRSDLLKTLAFCLSLTKEQTEKIFAIGQKRHKRKRATPAASRLHRGRDRCELGL